MRYVLIMWVMVAVVTSATVAEVGSAPADGHGQRWEDDDYAYDRARRAVNRGEILPIANLLERLKTRVPGEVVGVEFKSEKGQWVYEFKIIDANGRLLEVYVDARSGAILSTEID